MLWYDSHTVVTDMGGQFDFPCEWTGLDQVSLSDWVYNDSTALPNVDPFALDIHLYISKKYMDGYIMELPFKSHFECDLSADSNEQAIYK